MTLKERIDRIPMRRAITLAVVVGLLWVGAIYTPSIVGWAIGSPANTPTTSQPAQGQQASSHPAVLTGINHGYEEVDFTPSSVRWIMNDAFFNGYSHAAYWMCLNLAQNGYGTDWVNFSDCYFVADWGTPPTQYPRLQWDAAANCTTWYRWYASNNTFAGVGAYC